MLFAQSQSVVHSNGSFLNLLIYKDFYKRMKLRFPLWEPWEIGRNKEQKPYVSMICKVFSYLGRSR